MAESPASLKFGYDIVYDVIKHHSKEELTELYHESRAIDAPVLYTNYGKRLVSYYFKHYRGYVSDFRSRHPMEKMDEAYFSGICEDIIQTIQCQNQGCEVFYYMCIRIGVLASITLQQGYRDTALFAVNKIASLATQAYDKRDLDARYDLVTNFVLDLVEYVFNWVPCDRTVHFQMQKFETEDEDYFPLHQKPVRIFLERQGRDILLSSNIPLNREMLTYQILEWCSDFFGRPPTLTPRQHRDLFLEICIKIALLAVNSVFQQCSYGVQHTFDALTKLAISAARENIL